MKKKLFITFYLLLVSVCLFAQPANDLSCSFLTVADDCTPTSGTTINATQNVNITGSCAPNAEIDVFYEFTLSAGFNSVIIDALNLSSGGDLTVLLGTWTTDCSDGSLSIIDTYCGSSASKALDVSGLVAGTTYVIVVATSQADQGSFDLTICGSGPPPGCSDNDFCVDAEVFPAITSESTYVCLDGCNIGASSETNQTGCNMATEEVVWFQFNTDNDATLASIYINSSDIESPTLEVFSGGCENLTSITNCVTGSNYFAQHVNFDVSTNSTYWVAVSNDFGDGGEFSLCIQTIDDPSSCVLQSSIEVVSTSLGSPLTGPFQPEEDIEICYTINSYTSSGNNCAWLQGIIPIFGCGWDDSSFDANGMPTNISIPISTLYAGTWGWYTDVTYNNATSTKSVGDFDGDGDLDMCHYTEPNCSNTGLSPGDIMPGGWYNANPADGPPNGHPNIDYGDGNACNTTLGPWTVCFVLTTKDLTQCEDCTDATVRVYTTADGETGGWNGGSSLCSNDLPQVFDGKVNCCIGPELQQPLTQTICSGETSLLELLSDADPGATYSWTPIPNSSISGASAGSGKYISNTLVNSSDILETQIYEVIPVDATGCPGLPQEVTIDVLPQIIVDAGPDIDGCAQGEFTLGGNPTATGGAAPYTYEWSNPSFGNDPNPTASPNLTTTYLLTGTDEQGCTAMDTITITVEPLASITMPETAELCGLEEHIVQDVTVEAYSALTWSIKQGAGSLYPTTAVSPTYTPAPSDLNSEVELELEATGEGACIDQKDTQIYRIQYKALPSQINSIETSTEDICIGQPMDFVISTTGDENTNLSYTILPPAGHLSGIQSEVITVQWNETGEYSLIVESSNDCGILADTTFIEVNPLDAIYDTIGFCLGETLEYEGNSIKEVGDYRFEDGSKACFDAYYVHVVPIEEYFQVEDESIIIDVLNGPHEINILDNDQLPSEYTVELKEATNPSFKNLGFEDGLLEFDITKQFVDPIRVPYEVCEVNTRCNYCETGELSIIHEEYKDVIYPNVMTPNGDGINDYLRFNDAPELPHVRLLIYNRWGDKIHESFPYKNDWDGDIYPDGVYFYILQVGDDYIKRSFMLLR